MSAGKTKKSEYQLCTAVLVFINQGPKAGVAGAQEP